MLTTGLLMTIQSFSQNVTNNDTLDLTQPLVCIPVPIMDSIIADLKSGDIAKEEVVVLNEQVRLRTTLAENLEKVIEGKDKIIVNCQNALTENSNLTDSYKLQLDKVARKSEKQKKLIKVLSIISITSLFLNLANL